MTGMHAGVVEGIQDEGSVAIGLGSGRLSCDWMAPEVHAIRCGDIMIAKAVTVKVRDSGWRTIPPVVLRHERRVADNKVVLTVECSHDDGNVAFRWSGEFTAELVDETTSRFSATMSGRVTRHCSARRLGLCVLHPLGLAGVRVVLQSGGRTTEGVFPSRIAPWQPFSDFTQMSYVAQGLRTRIRFTGDSFETEDQRNWSDASYKTYCPPLKDGPATQFEPGDVCSQSVVIEISHAPVGPPVTHPKSKPCVIRLDLGATRSRLPSIGTGTGVLAELLPGPASRFALRELGLSHLHTVIQPTVKRWEDQLLRAANLAAYAEARLQCEVVVEDSRALAVVAAVLGDILSGISVSLAGVMPFDLGTSTTSEELVRSWVTAAARHGLPGGVIGGSRANFAELNRGRLPWALLSGATFALCPQVHAVSSAEIIDTLASHEMLARQARHIGGERPLHVGPITLLPRVGAEPLAAVTTLPQAGDPRQRSLLLACWTLGSISAFGWGGAGSLTYFEHEGPNGLMSSLGDEDGGGVALHPVYALLRVLKGLAGAPLIATDVIGDGPGAVLAVAGDNGLVVILGNLSSRRVPVTIDAAGARFEVGRLGLEMAKGMLAGQPFGLRSIGRVDGALVMDAFEIVVLREVRATGRCQ